MKKNEAHTINPEDYKALQGMAAVEARIKGKRPLLLLSRQLFEVDVERVRLLPVGYDLPGVEFEKGAFHCEDSEHRIFYYHRQRMEDLDLELLSPGQKVLLVRIPAPVALDPVMTAIINGYKPTDYLDEYPLVMYREAETITLSPSLIRLLHRRPALRDDPGQLFKMTQEQRNALTVKGKRKRL